MDLDTARQVLLVASLEEADAAGELVPHELRRRASDAAPDPGEHGDAADSQFTAGEVDFLAARARAVVAGMDGRAGLPHPAGAVAIGRLGGALLAGAMFLLGFLSKELGPAGVVNILAFPLLGVMVWNLAVYAVMAVRELAGSRPSGLAHWIINWLEAKARRGGGDGTASFAARWSRVAAPLWAARTSAWLHLGAAALALGAVFAMYWQGIIRDYQATWESTFLSADGVRGLLSVALAPAAWVPGLALPDAAAIEAIRAPGGERAAAWIHRFALAAAVVVICPRLVLATCAMLRARSRARSLDVRAQAPGYFKTVLAERRGTKSVVRVVPHRIELDPKRRDALRAALHEHWGGVLWLEFLDPVAYGDEEEFADRAPELADSDHVAVVAGFGATPEDESQGRLLRAVRAAAAGGEVLLWLDEGGFAERYGAGRSAERAAAWAKLAAAVGVELIPALPPSK